MKLSVKMLLLLFCILLTYSSAEGKTDGKPISEKDLDKVKLDDKGFDKVKTIHTNWYVHSVKALIAQLSRNLLPKLSDDLKTEFVECLSKIHDKKDLAESAKCVMKAREQYQVQRKWRPRAPKPSMLLTSRSLRKESKKSKELKKISIKKLEEMKKNLPKELQIPKFTRKITTDTVLLPGEEEKPKPKVYKSIRTVATWNSEKKKELLEKKRKDLEMARKIHKTRKMFHTDDVISQKMKNWKNERRIELCQNKTFCAEKKTDLIIEFKKKWRHLKTSKRSKRSLTRLVVDTVSKSDGNDHGFFVKNMRKMPSLRTKTKSPVERVTGLLRAFFTNHTQSDPSWGDTYKALINLKKKMDEKEKESGARVYNERMYDLVLDVQRKDNDVGAMFDKEKMPGLVRHAFNLMSTIEGSSKKQGDSNYKYLSPRFASVMPDKNENRGRLSPSILSFYNDESEDQILPLPKMLDATGMRGKDRDSIIELVMEISGVKGIVHSSMEMLKSTDMPELDLAMDTNSKKSLQMVQDIQKSYSRKQKKDMKNSGFTLMDPLQMEKLMSEQGILGRDDIFNLKEYAMMTIGQRKNMVWDMVKGIAYGITGMNIPQLILLGVSMRFFNIGVSLFPVIAKAPGFQQNSTTSRVKRQANGIWGPHILAPTVLSPILFTPIFGLNVLGPTVLSPGLFTPLLLNPAVLSPYVFSPTVGIPFILSPYLLSPYVFSPLVMAPFILNPYVLSPNVFNPYVLSPLILSPLVICPDVVSPMTLGGAILSPAVLSPSLLSKSYIMANVLSPTFLS